MKPITGHLVSSYVWKDASVRADRLVEVLLLLQRRGQVTAREVADELEVSERTARRDLDALGMAGLPVYSVQGRNGGWRLLGDATTDLSGLSAPEVRALFMVAGPSNSDPEVRSALRKLVAALPETFRERAETATGAVVVDRSAWGSNAPDVREPEHLNAVQDAVVTSTEVELGYVARNGADSTRSIQPLGLASKGTNWYLVADTDNGRRTFRVDRVTSVTPTTRRFTRPDDFDLGSEWQQVVDAVDRQRAPVSAAGRIKASALHPARYVFGSRMRLGPSIDAEWSEVELRGHSVQSLSSELAGFGAELVVETPVELRRELARIAGELVAEYGA